MYLSTLKLWNFRKYGAPGEIDIKTPHLQVLFKQGLNVLVGQNDSGKTAIIDAIKLVLKTHAYEWIRPVKEDFHKDSTVLRIELEIVGLTDSEASHFVEWLGWKDNIPFIRIIYQARLKEGVVISSDVKAGQSVDGIQLTAEAKEYLKTTYLRPLRDANNDLTAGRNSRFSQILEGHKLLKKVEGEMHELESIAEHANKETKKWFMSSNGGENSSKAQIIDVIDGFIHDFINEGFSSDISLVPPEIHTILEKLSLGVNEDAYLGLGTLNRLYMAAELLHLKNPARDSLNLCLIEELEAHLHPQSQLKVITSLQKQPGVQFILTTHSPNITSQLDLANDGVNLLMCKNESVFSLRSGETKLTAGDYNYLKTFLDVTKCNLFFAKGLFLVEGWAEEIIIPALALKMGFDFTKRELSIINVGSTAYLRFAHIFMPNDGTRMGVKVAAITDLDVPPVDGKFDDEEEEKQAKSKVERFEVEENGDVKLYIANHWTLEWCLFTSASTKDCFMDAVASVHSKTPEFKKAITEGSVFPVYNEELFKRKLIEKLLPGAQSKLDKVAVAYAFVDRIKNVKMQLSENDSSISYLVKAINHVCKEIG